MTYDEVFSWNSNKQYVHLVELEDHLCQPTSKICGGHIFKYKVCWEWTVNGKILKIVEHIVSDNNK